MNLQDDNNYYVASVRKTLELAGSIDAIAAINRGTMICAVHSQLPAYCKVSRGACGVGRVGENTVLP